MVFHGPDQSYLLNFENMGTFISMATITLVRDDCATALPFCVLFCPDRLPAPSAIIVMFAEVMFSCHGGASVDDSCDFTAI